MAPLLISLWCFLLIISDLRWRRLPDRLTLPGALGIAGWVLGEGHPAALLGGLSWAGLYLLTAVTLGGIGGGDIKFALGLGTLSALGGVSGWLLAVTLASVSTLLLALFRSLFRALSPGPVAVGEPGRALPHGPSMVVGTAGALLMQIPSDPGWGWVM